MDEQSKNPLKRLAASFDDTPAASPYTVEEGGIRYIDGSALRRPLNLPKNRLPIALGFAVIAAVIGIFLASNILSSTMHAAERAAASVDENLAREVSLDMPAMSTLTGMDATGIKNTVDGFGLNIYTVSSDEDIANGTLEIVKMPSDVSIEEGMVYYSQGIANLDGPDAALLLNGMWLMQFDSADGYNLAVRYVDFDSGSIDAAIEAAIAAQGFDSASATDLQVDESGNTYRTGTFDAGGATYNWRVSAIPLSAVYDISGLPDSAVYVGVRTTAS